MADPPAIIATRPARAKISQSEGLLFFQTSWKWLVASTLISLAAVVAGKLLWSDWPTLGAWGALFGLVAAAMAIMAHLYAMIGAYEARMARREISKTQAELVEMSLLLEDVSSYAQAFEGHVIRYTKQTEEITKSLGTLRGMRFLISTPVYGYHVLGEAYRDAFYECLSRTTPVPTELILFSPDSHYSHFANTLLWQALPAPRAVACKRASGMVLAQELSRLLTYIWATDADRPLHDQHRRFLVWATTGSNIRFSYFDFSKNPRAILMLTDDVRLSSDLLQFSGRFLPINRMLHSSLVRGPGSFFEQFKDCPYSGGRGIEAAVKPSEITRLIGDYLWLRTRGFVLPYTVFQSEIKDLTALQPPPVHVVQIGINAFLDYFAFLESRSDELHVHLSVEQHRRLTALRNIQLAQLTTITAGDFEKQLTPILAFITEAVGPFPTPVLDLIRTADEEERKRLYLFLLASSGFGTSTFATRL
jgi:hypothetical protein